MADRCSGNRAAQADFTEQLVQARQDDGVGGTVAAGLAEDELHQVGEAGPVQDHPERVVLVPYESRTRSLPAISASRAEACPRAWIAVVGSLMPGERALVVTSVSC